jgi:hypothetical protein
LDGGLNSAPHSTTEIPSADASDQAAHIPDDQEHDVEAVIRWAHFHELIEQVNYAGDHREADEVPRNFANQVDPHGLPLY